MISNAPRTRSSEIIERVRVLMIGGKCSRRGCEPHARTSVLYVAVLPLLDCSGRLGATALMMMHRRAENDDLVVRQLFDRSLLFRIADAAEVSPALVQQLIDEVDNASPLENDRCLHVSTAAPCSWNMCTTHPFRADTYADHHYCRCLRNEVKYVIQAAHPRAHVPVSAETLSLSRRAVEERICRAIAQTGGLQDLCPDTQATIATQLRLAAPVDLHALAATCRTWHASLAPWLRRQRNEVFSQRIRMRRTHWKVQTSQIMGGALSFDDCVETPATLMREV